MQGNRNNQYSFKENEADFYHLRMTFRTHIPAEKRYVDEERTVIVSQRDFPPYRNPETQQVIGWAALEILHDPTIKKSIESDENSIGDNEPVAVSEPIVKPKFKPKRR